MRKRITYANVTATLALVFAMSGGALAANHYLINSTKQISPKVLKKLKGKTGKTGAAGVPGAAGKEGAPGKEGAAGKTGERGPSHAFDVKVESVEFPSTENEPITVASLSLPAGSYSVLGKTIANNNAASIAGVECRLELGGTVIDEGGFIRMTEEGKGADRMSIVDSGVGTLSSAGTATLKCEVSSTSGEYIDAAVTAVQVGGVN
ncbi:MAG TPA: hypothetical protein VFY36_08850 [Solirubrobacteraceae bacterium]|nr:hypothetical protein [Solirubrobacteraceae bacterium]